MLNLTWVGNNDREDNIAICDHHSVREYDSFGLYLSCQEVSGTQPCIGLGYSIRNKQHHGKVNSIRYDGSGLPGNGIIHHACRLCFLKEYVYNEESLPPSEDTRMYTL